MQGQKGMIRLDTHTHSNGISRCSQVTYAELVVRKKEQGYDGIILTNHCNAWYYQPSDHLTYVKQVLSEYTSAKLFAQPRGLKVLLGLEVTLTQPFYADWLLFGLTDKLLEKSPCFHTLTQQQLFEYCQEKGLVLVQAHPYRQQPGESAYMHGVEINCSQGDLERTQEVLEHAKANGLIVTCGTDFHGLNPVFGGTYAPSAVETAADFAEYLKSAKETKLFLDEENLNISIPEEFRQKNLKKVKKVRKKS